MANPDRAVFRLPWVSVVFPLLLLICVIPLATYRPPFLVLFAIPVLALVYILVTHTTADIDRIVAVRPWGSTRIPWNQLDGFEFHGSRWAVAVELNGRHTRLPMVRPRDLPLLAAVSGGRLTLDPPADRSDGDEGADSVAADQPVDQIGDNQPAPTIADQDGSGRTTTAGSDSPVAAP